MGLSHFDEGVYTLSGFWSIHTVSGPALYPWQKFFAPPGYYILVGFGYLLFGGASELAAIGINVAMGAATAVLVWWLGQRWLGPSCGAFAGALVAMSEFHIAFSRAALTDTAFTFLFLLSLALIAVCIEQQRFASAAWAGLAVGATWNMKYHGWFPLALALLVISIEALTAGDPAKKAWRLIRLWLVVSGVAAACFLPWLVYTQTRLGGYLAIERFHRQFLDFHWSENFLRQVEAQHYFDGWLSRISPALAFVGALAANARQTARPWRVIMLGIVALLISGLILGGTGTAALLSLFGAVTAWRAGKVFGRLLVCALAVLFVLTPCYTPYARLVLPWAAIAAVLAGVAIQRFLSTEDAVPASTGTNLWKDWRVGASVAGTVVMLLGGAIMWGRTTPGPRTWASTRSVGGAASKIMGVLPRDSVVLVEQEPEIAFYFRRAGYTTYCINQLAQVRSIPPSPLFVVVGRYARETPDWAPLSPSSRASHFRNVLRIAIDPSDIRLLDDMSPRNALQYRFHPDSSYDLELYRWIPPAMR
jgi:4-amino-4-deoxy-L-arabinose transferase-like glycosyltransferase